MLQFYSITTQVACAVVTVIPTLHNTHIASGNNVIYGLRMKRNANISCFGGRRKLKSGTNIIKNLKNFKLKQNLLLNLKKFELE